MSMQYSHPPSTRKPAKPAKPAAHAVRSYLFKVDPRCNAGKLELLQAMHAEWQRVLPEVGSYLWSRFLVGEVNGKSLSSSVGASSVFGTTPLVTSVKQCMAVAIEGQIKTWRANLKRRITRLVMRSQRYSNADARRHQLLWLNSMQLWLVPYDKQLELLAAAGAKTKVNALEPRLSRLLARYVRAYVHRFKPPRFEQLPLQVNQLSSVWSSSRDTVLSGVSAWLRISTLVRGERIELPIRHNAYAARFAGEQALTFSLQPRGKHWYVKVCKKLERADSRPPSGAVLGLDTGLTNMLATSQGAIYGQGFNQKLRRWDEQLLRLTKGLQAAGEVRLGQCRRYRDFTRRMRGGSRAKSRLR